MFESIEIERFRGIKHSRIDGLRQINLFFGKNNCGKSSLLDAVFLISGLSNPKLPININLLRSYRKFELPDLALDFYSLDTTGPISIKASNKETRELQISLFESASGRIDFHGSDAEYEQRVKLDSRYKENIVCRYLTPQSDFYTSLSGLIDITKNKDEKFILDALRLIEPKINDIVLSGNEVLVDVGQNKRIPINMMGDGVRKILSVLTTIYECRDGVVLIDEISNGFHYSVMKDLWRTVLLASKKNNAQIYATTHDIDSIKGLRDAVRSSDDGNNSVACFKLQRTSDDELKSYYYAIDSIDYALNQEIEIR